MGGQYCSAWTSYDHISKPFRDNPGIILFVNQTKLATYEFCKMCEIALSFLFDCHYSMHGVGQLAAAAACMTFCPSNYHTCRLHLFTAEIAWGHCLQDTKEAFGAEHVFHPLFCLSFCPDHDRVMYTSLSCQPGISMHELPTVVQAKALLCGTVCDAQLWSLPLSPATGSRLGVWRSCCH